jgi:transketolase
MSPREVFERRSTSDRDHVLLLRTADVATEQTLTLGRDRSVADRRAVIGMHTFGAPTPLEQILNEFAFTPERVTKVAQKCLRRK